MDVLEDIESIIKSFIDDNIDSIVASPGEWNVDEIIKAEHVPGTPYHYRHGWIPVGELVAHRTRSPGGRSPEKVAASRVGAVKEGTKPNEVRPHLEFKRLRAERPSTYAGHHKATNAERKALRIPPNYENAYVPDDPSQHNFAWKASAVLPQKDGSIMGDLQHGPRRPDFAESRDGAKFARVAELTPHLPKLDRAIKKNALTDARAAATMLSRKYGFRPGTRAEGLGKKGLPSYGSATLLAKHVKVNGNHVTFHFMGKEQVLQHHEFDDKETADMIRHYSEGKAPNSRLFNIKDQNSVKEFMSEHIPPQFLAKDLRTHLANRIARFHLKGMTKASNANEFRAKRNSVAKIVSESLGNKPKQTLDSYIDPAAFDSIRHPGA